jgi:FMN phosphatase YigB (HAD superfamily)
VSSVTLWCNPSQQSLYAAVSRRLRLSSDVECIVIDDSQPNVEAAASAGWRAILFDPDRLATHTPEYLEAEIRRLL